MQRNVCRFLRQFSAIGRCHQALVSRTVSSDAMGGQQQGTTNQDTARPPPHSDFSAEDQQTHFGFQTVSEKEKEQKVYEVFHNVAQKYDVMNDVMSCGIHRLWKDHFVCKMAPTAGTRLLDVAGGTGDIAFRFLDYIKNDTTRVEQPTGTDSVEQPTGTNSETHVTVCDINQAMLDVGQQSAAARGLQQPGSMSWLLGNAEELPVADESYDVFTIAFGIRNVTHIETVLSEAYRVLRRGGRFLCLEFSEVPNPLLRRAYDAYSFNVIPVMGKVVAGDWKSYQYLVESIRQFPCQEDFKDMIEDAGFCNVTYENLTFGVAAIHSGFKL